MLTKRSAPSENVSVLITLTAPPGYCSEGAVYCLAAKEVHTLLNHMRELQKKFFATPDHAEELAKIEQIFNELKPKLECGGARLRCLLDIEKKLREKTAEEHFAAGFALGWEIRKELQNAGVLSAHDGEIPGTVMSKGQG